MSRIIYPNAFDENSPNYILFIEGTSYNDTISDINFERKGCKEKIKNFEYSLMEN